MAAVSTERYEMDPQGLAWLLSLRGFLSEGKSLEEATLEYQKWHGLLVDGWAGPDTEAHLLRPRFCSYPDNFTAEGIGVGAGIPRWGKKLLLIHCEGRLGSLSKQDFIDGCIKGAQGWSQVCGLQFDYTDDPNRADIIVDTGRIDGPGRTLAYMQLPMRDGHMDRLRGRVDDDERWNLSTSLEVVMRHEIGHAMGLGHTNVPNQLMNPYLSSIKMPQPEWDIVEAVKRYGGPQSGGGGGTSPEVGPLRICLDLRTDLTGEIIINDQRRRIVR